MREGTAPLVRREDYTAPAFWIKTVDLTFDLDPAKTLVINKMTVEPNPGQSGAALRLDGEDITLTRVLVDELQPAAGGGTGRRGRCLHDQGLQPLAGDHQDQRPPRPDRAGQKVARPGERYIAGQAMQVELGGKVALVTGAGQGIGQAMLEHTVYDPESGQLLSGSLMDYALPRADAPRTPGQGAWPEGCSDAGT